MADEPRYARSTCGSCGAGIIWTITAAKGKAMPIDFEPSENGNVELRFNPKEGDRRPLAVVHAQRPLGYDGPLRMAHHATCAQREEWAKRRRS